MKKTACIMAVLALGIFSNAGTLPGCECSAETTNAHLVNTARQDSVSYAENDQAFNLGFGEERPSFPGGDVEMMKWLSSNINYPPEAYKEGVSGKVTVSFIIEKDGSVSNVNVVRGKHPALDAEAVRVVKKMPKWSPGRCNGQPVRVTHMIPVTFRTH